MSVNPNLIILRKNDQVETRDDQIEWRYEFAGDWQESGAFCRVVEDADPYGGDAVRQTELVGAGVL